MKKCSYRDAVRARALRYLAQREHSRCELERKLRLKIKHPAEYAEIPRVLTECETAGLQSEMRFTASYIHMRQEKGYGPLHIRQGLLGRGVCPTLIDTHLYAPDMNWMEILKRVWEKKYRGVQPADIKQYAAQLRFLLHRGFMKTMIIDLLEMCPHGIYDES